MNFVDYTLMISENTGVDVATVRKVLKGIYKDADQKLDEGQVALLPQFGRVVTRQMEDGTNRYILHRAKKPQLSE